MRHSCNTPEHLMTVEADVRLVLAFEVISALAISVGAGLAAGLWAGLVVGGVLGILACEWTSRTVPTK